MVRTHAAILRPFIAAVVVGVLLGTSACGPLQQTGPDALRFSSAQHFLRTDLVKMKLDLWRERSEAGPGAPGPTVASCYNLRQNVDVEINTMDSFAAGTVTDNVAAMQSNVATLRAERSDFERDINDFVNDGVVRPKSEPATIEAITVQIRAAVTEADATIMRIRAKLQEAHSSAARLATSSCASAAPEVAPTIPLVH